MCPHAAPTAGWKSLLSEAKNSIDIYIKRYNVELDEKRKYFTVV